MEGVTPLLAAADAGSNDAVLELVAAKATVTVSDQAGNTVLIHATAKGLPLSTIKELVQAGAPFNRSNLEGITPLMNAAARGDHDVVKFLIERGADIQSATTQHDTDSAEDFAPPVHSALSAHPMQTPRPESGSQRVASGSFRGSAPGSARSPQTQRLAPPSPLVTPVTPRISTPRTPNYSDSNHQFDEAAMRARGGLTALMMAAAAGHDEVVKLLLSHGADPFALDAQGCSALMYAAAAARTVVVTTILSRTAGPTNATYINSDSLSGNSALILAAMSSAVSTDRPRIPLELERMIVNDRATHQDIADTMAILLKHGANPNAQNNQGMGALAFVAEFGNHLAMRVLLDAKAAVEIASVSGQTPLILAAEDNHVECVRALLEHHASTKIKNRAGYTALLRAAVRGREATCLAILAFWRQLRTVPNLTEAALFSLDHDIEESITAVDRFGESVLHWAAFNNLNKFIEAALGFKVPRGPRKGESILNVGLRDNDGNTPLFIAARCGWTECVRNLLAAGASLTENNSGNSPLAIACRKGHGAVVEALLLHPEADVNTPNGEGQSPLLLAAQSSNPDIITVLVRRGADIDNDGGEALLQAIKCRNEDVAIELVELGADVDYVDRDGLCAVLLAGDFGLTRLMGVLVDYGANVAVVSNDQRSALLGAAQAGHTQTAIVILHALVEAQRLSHTIPKATLGMSKSQLHLATVMASEANSPHTPFVNLPDSHGDCPLLCAARSRDEALLLELLAQPNIRVDVVDSHSKGTALHMIAERSLVNAAAKILSLASIAPLLDARDRTSRTPLICAATHGNSKIVRMLVERGASIDAFDRDRVTALISATRKGHAEAARVLIEKGANVVHADRRGNTALTWAISNTMEEIVMRLVSGGAEDTKSLLKSLPSSASTRPTREHFSLQTVGYSGPIRRLNSRTLWRDAFLEITSTGLTMFSSSERSHTKFHYPLHQIRGFRSSDKFPGAVEVDVVLSARHRTAAVIFQSTEGRDIGPWLRVLRKVCHAKVLDGVLLKKGKFDRFLKRYFFLTPNELRYFASPDQLEPSAVVSITHIESVAPSNLRDDNGCGFFLTATLKQTKKTYHLRAPSDVQARRWITALQGLLPQRHAASMLTGSEISRHDSSAFDSPPLRTNTRDVSGSVHTAMTFVIGGALEIPRAATPTTDSPPPRATPSSELPPVAAAPASPGPEQPRRQPGASPGTARSSAHGRMPKLSIVTNEGSESGLVSASAVSPLPDGIDSAEPWSTDRIAPESDGSGSDSGEGPDDLPVAD
eukprot:TRINITY_DN2254_c1_g1_i3.p1 TRINITY_DN2254_c1_g1~~TRINITY_DN2254_c1_g1_i3.p1  ORF type:complete len:1464 (+),score=327.19 TRINITY_DN2254_c1_g1_i3:559-4392(+)